METTESERESLISNTEIVTDGDVGHDFVTRNCEPIGERKFQLPRIIERNVDYLSQQLGQLFEGRRKNNQSPFVGFVCFTIIALYVMNLVTVDPFLTVSQAGTNADELSHGKTTGSSVETTAGLSTVTQLLTFTPGNILSPRFWLWSALSTVTYSLVEMHWWQVVVDIIVVYLSTTLIEPLWGSRELISFFIVINLIVAFLTTTHYIVLYSIYGDDKYLYNVRLYGLSGYCAAICVTVKQLLSQSVLVSTSVGKFTNNNVPLLALISSFLLYSFKVVEGCLVLMFLYGLLISWFYLRFIQPHNNGTRGDFSDGFAFDSFFPQIVRPYIAFICNNIYQFFVYIYLCSPQMKNNQNIRQLGERLNQEHIGATAGPSGIPPSKRPHPHFKHHQSGDYQYLHQPMNV